MCAHDSRHSVNAAPEKKSGPGKKSDQHDGDVEPERLNVLKLRRQVALEIVLDDEDAQEIRIEPSAANVPGQGCCAKRSNSHRMKQTERVMFPFGYQSPEKYRAAA